MIASAQFTIISLCDVVTSDTAPENPYDGQLWADTSVTPPETKIWDGNEWVVQNDIETIRTTISILTEKDAQFQQTIDGAEQRRSRRSRSRRAAISSARWPRQSTRVRTSAPIQPAARRI